MYQYLGLGLWTTRFYISWYLDMRIRHCIRLEIVKHRALSRLGKDVAVSSLILYVLLTLMLMCVVWSGCSQMFLVTFMVL